MTGSDQPAQAPKHGRHGSQQRATHVARCPRPQSPDPSPGSENKRPRPARGRRPTDGTMDTATNPAGSQGPLLALNLLHCRTGREPVCHVCVAPPRQHNYGRPGRGDGKADGSRMVDDRARSRSASRGAMMVPWCGEGGGAT
jgi:hypothetical protein